MSEEPLPPTQSATPALILGGLGMILWLLPIAGLPISIAGLVQATRARGAARAKLALILSAVGIALAIVYAVVGVAIGMRPVGAPA